MPTIQPVSGPDYGNLILQGLGAYQKVKGIQRGQEVADREKRIRELRSLAQSDPAALQELMTLDPRGAAAIQQQRQLGQTQALSRQALRDPAALEQLAALDPSRAGKLQAFQGARREADAETQTRFEQERARTAALIKDLPLDQQLQTLDWRIDMIKRRGGDPVNTEGLRNLLASGDPGQVAQGQNAIRNAYQLGIMQKHIEPEKPPAELALIRKIRAAGIDPNSPTGQQLVLADLMGQQISVTGPDGSVITVGKGLGKDGSGLVKSAKNLLQKQAITLKRDIDAFDKIEERYQKEFLQLSGQVKSAVTGAKSYLGLPVGQKETKFAQEKRFFTQPVQQLFNRYLNEYAGVRVIADELKRQQEAMINNQQNPVVFEAALKEGKASAKRGLRLLNKILREGVSGSLKNPRSPAAKEVGALFGAGEDDSALSRIRDLQDEGKNEDEIYETLNQEGYEF